jgi:hypothetical protein
MKAASRPAQKFRLTASNIAKYFANRCDRNFRWNTVAGPLRGKSGIGWNVPKKLRAHSRPGIALLMEAGNLFEGDQVQALIDEFGKQAVLAADIERTEDGCKVKELPFSDFIAAFQSEPFPQVVTQLEVVLDEEQEARLLKQFGLDAAHVTLCPARPNVRFNDVEKFRKPHAWDLGKRFRRACTAAKIKDLRIHDLRHFATTMLLIEGVPDAIIRKMTGHRSEELERYKHLSPSFKQQSGELIAGQLATQLATKLATPSENTKGRSKEQP